MSATAKQRQATAAADDPDRPSPSSPSSTTTTLPDVLFIIPLQSNVWRHLLNSDRAALRLACKATRDVCYHLVDSITMDAGCSVTDVCSRAQTISRFQHLTQIYIHSSQESISMQVSSDILAEFLYHMDVTALAKVTLAHIHAPLGFATAVMLARAMPSLNHLTLDSSVSHSFFTPFVHCHNLTTINWYFHTNHASELSALLQTLLPLHGLKKLRILATPLSKPCSFMPPEILNNMACLTQLESLAILGDLTGNPLYVMISDLQVLLLLTRLTSLSVLALRDTLDAQQHLCLLSTFSNLQHLELGKDNDLQASSYAALCSIRGLTSLSVGALKLLPSETHPKMSSLKSLTIYDQATCEIDRLFTYLQLMPALTNFDGRVHLPLSSVDELQTREEQLRAVSTRLGAPDDRNRHWSMHFNSDTTKCDAALLTQLMHIVGPLTGVTNLTVNLHNFTDVVLMTLCDTFPALSLLHLHFCPDLTPVGMARVAALERIFYLEMIECKLGLEAMVMLAVSMKSTGGTAGRITVACDEWPAADQLEQTQMDVAAFRGNSTPVVLRYDSGQEHHELWH